eukprot:1706129-Rhodomonas_salina.1
MIRYASTGRGVGCAWGAETWTARSYAKTSKKALCGTKSHDVSASEEASCGSSSQLFGAERRAEESRGGVVREKKRGSAEKDVGVSGCRQDPLWDVTAAVI